jgi:hypothetical protein
MLIDPYPRKVRPVLKMRTREAGTLLLRSVMTPRGDGSVTADQ